MALFPTCTFALVCEGGSLRAGQSTRCELVLEVGEPIVRAERVEIAFVSTARANPDGSLDRHASQAGKIMFEARQAFEVPATLAAGAHRFPFELALPAWLPPGYSGAYCGITHEVHARLVVDWARDPTTELLAVVLPEPVEDTRAPLVTRSPALWGSVVLEVSLESRVLLLDEPLRGHIALREGRHAGVTHVDLSFTSLSTVTMLGTAPQRSALSSTVRIPIGHLLGGEAVPFELPALRSAIPSFKTSFIDHDPVLAVTTSATWHMDADFTVPLRVLPRGSVLHGGEDAPPPVGGTRLRQLSTTMAEASGLVAGHSPVLVQGAVGAVQVRISNALRGGQPGVDVDLTFPDVGLGIAFRPLGLLDGFRESPLLPPDLLSYYLAVPHAGRHEKAFVDACLRVLGAAEDLRFSDHHLGMHFALHDDEEAQLTALARSAADRARTIDGAIARLPFREVARAGEDSWRATAEEESAFLVPTGPVLHGIVRRARVHGGEERTVRITVRSVARKDGELHDRVELDLADLRLPPGACAALADDRPTEHALLELRAVFPRVRVAGDGCHAELERDAWSVDPRALLPVLDLLFGWILEIRGDRRLDAPYR